MVINAQWLGFRVLVVSLTITVTFVLMGHNSYAGSLRDDKILYGRTQFGQKIIRFNNKTFHISYELKTPFSVLKGGKLAICVEQEWVGRLPVEPFEALFLILPSKLIEIDDLNKLRGWVKIDTSKAAMAFVRLKTSPKTYHAFRTRWEVEIVTRHQIDADFLFGDKVRSEYLRKSGGSGYLGIVGSKDKLNQLGIELPSCSKHKGGYEIRRTLLVEDLKTNRLQILRVVEFVGQDGRYIRKESHPLDSPKVRAYPWYIPEFE